MKIGIIAEDDDDVEVMNIITGKFVSSNSFSFKKFVGRGSGKLRSKCGTWAKILCSKGCELIIVLHDLDRHIESELRAFLNGKIQGVKTTEVLILIPVEELEAWLLADPNAIKQSFSMAKLPKIPVNPEGISSPKEYLRDIIWKEAKVRYANTVHNKKIAQNLSKSALYKCNSFKPYSIFLAKYFS